MAAMVTRGRRARAPRVAWKLALTSSGPPSIWAMSAPAAKMRRPPQTTTAPGRSAARSSAMARNWTSTVADRALAFGRSSRTRATPSGRRSTVTKVSTGAPTGSAFPNRGEQAVGGVVGVDPAVGQGADGVGEVVTGGHLLDLAEESGDEDPAELGGEPLPAAFGQPAGGGEVGPVPGDLGPQGVDAVSGGGDGIDDRRPPVARHGQVEHLFEVPTGFTGTGAVGLVDDEEVGHFEEAGLVGLHRVPPAGGDDDDGGVGGGGHVDLHLADADGLDDGDRHADGTEHPDRLGDRQGEAAE